MERDTDTGQFTSGETLTGLASVEAEAGYIPLPDPSESIPSDELTIEEGAKLLGIEGTPESEIQSYADGESYNDPTENPKETVKLERAANELEAYDARNADAAKQEKLQAIRDGTDQLRAPEPEPAAEIDGEKALNDPKLQEAVNKISSEAQLAKQEAESVKQSYAAHLQASVLLNEAAFISRYTEFANATTVEQVRQIAAELGQKNPSRLGEIQRDITQISTQLKQQEALKQQEEQASQAKRQAAAKIEGDRFEQLPEIKGTPKVQRAEIEAGIIARANQYGVNTDLMMKLLQSEYADAGLMRLLWDVGKLHRIESAPKAIPTRDIPPVQRPGFAQPKGSSTDEKIRSLDRQLDRTSGAKQLNVARQILNLMGERA